MNKTTLYFVQFLRPNGNMREERIELDDPDLILKSKRDEIDCFNLRLTCECLPTDRISFCIEEPGFGDFKIEMCKNGPDVPDTVRKLLKSFDAKEFAQWKKEMEEVS